MPRAGDLTPSYCSQGRRARPPHQAVMVRRHLPVAETAERANHPFGNSHASTRPGSFAGIVGIYQRHDWKSEKADALQRWADHLEALVTGKPSKVVKFGARR